ncbi:MAG: hypothetical protein FWH48_04035, partial [Oscillospiraceae bacterium]|nr:hypothetical protein [Oscillospiraceae bacterium]
IIDFARGTANGGSVSASTLNPADLGATGKLAWDEDYLYAQIVVSDDVHSQTNSAGNRWQDDGVQISIGNGNGWREMEFVLAGNLNDIYQYCYSNNTGASGGTGNVAQGLSTMQSEIVRDNEAKTTTYDIKINWAYVGILTPAAGDVAKIAITINDNDGSGRKDLAYFDGISTKNKGEGMGYLIMASEVAHEHESLWVEEDDCKKYICQECGEVEEVVCLEFDKAKTEPKRITSISEAVKGEWTIQFTVEIPYEDGDARIAKHSINIGKNSDGKLDLGRYILKYDIKGNGSNIKVFEIVKK